MPSRKRSRHLREDPAPFRTEPGLREIAASEAKTHFAELLDAAERGEAIAITRHGRRVARLVPETQQRQQQLDKVFAEFASLRKELRGKITLEELLAWRHEGHKY